MTGERLFDTHVVVDWSARNAPSPAKPTKDAIFWAVVRDGAKPRVFYARTRAAARTRRGHVCACAHTTHGARVHTHAPPDKKKGEEKGNIRERARVERRCCR